jgi:hypothetical protein
MYGRYVVYERYVVYGRYERYEVHGRLEGLLHPPSGRVGSEALRASGEGRCAREERVEWREERKIKIRGRRALLEGGIRAQCPERRISTARVFCSPAPLFFSLLIGLGAFFGSC